MIKLSTKISEFKQSHLGRESELSRTLAKVNLDKYILIKEKLTSIWNQAS